MSYIDLAELGSQPGTPPTAYLRIYASTDGSLHFVDDNGTFIGPLLFAPLVIPAQTELTIATGVVTPTGMHHSVDTEADAASDDLDTITAPTSYPFFNMLIIRPADDARSIVVKHNTGNIILSGGADITLDDLTDHILLFYDGTQWVNLQ